MNWNTPRDEHIIYEALSAIADNRVKLVDDNTAHIYSSSRNKYYIVMYNQDTKEIMSNDNMAFYVKEVSYPMVVMILIKKEVEYDKSILIHLKNIHWKDINKKNKNNYMKSVNEVLEILKEKGVDIEIIKNEVNNIFKNILSLKLKHLGKKLSPPNAY